MSLSVSEASPSSTEQDLDEGSLGSLRRAGDHWSRDGLNAIFISNWFCDLSEFEPSLKPHTSIPLSPVGHVSIFPFAASKVFSDSRSASQGWLGSSEEFKEAE